VNAQSAQGKRMGQNFLADRAAAERIVDALAIQPGEAVLEIGPGRGALTGGLIGRAGRIAAVELDEALVRELGRRHDESRLLLIHADILDVALDEVAARLGMPGTPLVVAGNLPYQISKPLALRLVEARHGIARAALMFQKEVALRLTASPGSREYGPLGVIAGLAYSIRRLFDLGPGAFRPRPKVSSSVTLWERRRNSPLDPDLEPRMRACLAGCFGRRRQTLRNNLRAALGSAERAEALLETAELDGSLRAEVLGPERFVQMARLWPV
jgi:16S rRNA (adenine1518-N6/adenine1519-N6)-dimethyltransferase